MNWNIHEELHLVHRDFTEQISCIEEHLASLKSHEILSLHEYLTARAIDRLTSVPLDPLLAHQYDLEKPSMDEFPVAMVWFEQLRTSIMGFHAYSVLCGLPPLTSTDAPSLSAPPYADVFDDSEMAWMAGNIGRSVLSDLIPTAYETESGEMWPRHIRGRGASELVTICYELTDSQRKKKFKTEARRYWGAMESAVEKINTSESWWEWFRGTNVREIRIKAAPAVSTAEASPRQSTSKLVGRRHEAILSPSFGSMPVEDGQLIVDVRLDLVNILAQVESSSPIPQEWNFDG
ncbi:hypothetical protein [Zhihengliuella sp.]|uniref:hypothetical protein n=1 Tax=Zhihengliuella sp. TaxID=1954483 RepID=UPI0028110366|nr:hypothetical protein [Zhihengliuella sp.]